MEETESSGPGQVVLEAATMKKNPEGWWSTASGRDSRATGDPEDVVPGGPGQAALSPTPTPGALSSCSPFAAVTALALSVVAAVSREAEPSSPPEPALTSLSSSSPAAPSGHQHRHTTGEKHAKEPGGKGKKNRNLKIGRITVSEKWRESVFHKITNANELKYLDEFLLNKVGRPGAGDTHGVRGGVHRLRSGPPQKGCHHPAKCSEPPWQAEAASPGAQLCTQKVVLAPRFGISLFSVNLARAQGGPLVTHIPLDEHRTVVP